MAANLLTFSDGYTILGNDIEGDLAIFMNADGEMSVDRYTRGTWELNYYNDSAYAGDSASKGTAFAISDGINNYYYKFGNYWWNGFGGNSFTFITDNDGLIADTEQGTLTATIELPDLPGVFFSQIVRYTQGNEFYTIQFDFLNTTSSQLSVRLGHGGDTYLYGGDSAQGFAYLADGTIITTPAEDDGSVIAVGGRKMDPLIAGNGYTSIDGLSDEVRIYLMSTDSSLSSYVTGYYGLASDEWGDDGSLNNSSAPADESLDQDMEDHGYALEWTFNVSGNSSGSVGLLEAFSLGSPSQLNQLFIESLTEAESISSPAVQDIVVENIVDGAIVQQGNLTSISDGMTVDERFIRTLQTPDDAVSDIAVLMVDGGEFIGQFDTGLAGYIGSANQLISASELISMSRAAASVNDTSVERAYQDFSMSTQVTNQLLGELGTGLIRYVYAGDFEIIDQSSGSKTFSVNNQATSGLIDVLNISKAGTDQLLVNLDGFTGMAIMGRGVDVTGSSSSDYVFAQGSATYQLGFGNDVIALNGMNAVINGGAGTDAVRVFGNSYSVNVLDIGGQISVTNGLGTSLLSGVEVIVLDNGWFKHADNSWEWVAGSAQSLDPVSLVGVSGMDISL